MISMIEAKVLHSETTQNPMAVFERFLDASVTVGVIQGKNPIRISTPNVKEAEVLLKRNGYTFVSQENQIDVYW